MLRLTALAAPILKKLRRLNDPDPGFCSSDFIDSPFVVLFAYFITLMRVPKAANQRACLFDDAGEHLFILTEHGAAIRRRRQFPACPSNSRIQGASIKHSIANSFG
jgi:hypothetical protein